MRSEVSILQSPSYLLLFLLVTDITILTWQHTTSLILIIPSFPRHSRRKDGFPIYESTATAKYLLEMGVPAEKIVEESYSLDTVGNVSSSHQIIHILSTHPPTYYQYIPSHTHSLNSPSETHTLSTFSHSPLSRHSLFPQ